MKNIDKISKASLYIGLIVYIVTCVIIGEFNLNLTDNWLVIIMMFVIYSPLALSGYLYTSKPKLKKSKRYYIIRFLIFFYGLILIGLIGEELRAIYPK